MLKQVNVYKEYPPNTVYMTDAPPPPPKTINETELFMKYKSSLYSAFGDFSFHSICMSFAFYLIWSFKNSWISIITIPLLSNMITRTFIVFHDCCHNSYTPNNIVNRIISHITGIFVLTSPNWILDHHTHHLTNGNIQNKYHYWFNETVLYTKQHFLSQSPMKKNIIRWYKHPFVFFSIIPFVYFAFIQKIIYSIKKYRHPYAFEKSLLMITADHIVNNTLVLLFLYIMYDIGILYHFLISFSFFASYAFMIFHNQHTFNPPYVVGNKQWTQRNSGLVGSSFIQIPKILKYFHMGIEYHHIHHMNAKIPGYNLHNYHEEVVSKSDIFDDIIQLNMSDLYKNLWLSLYDEDSSRYITFAEANEEKDKRIL
jgi:omega-6 fatty acid desaturase (delta-12 desaturase)